MPAFAVQGGVRYSIRGASKANANINQSSNGKVTEKESDNEDAYLAQNYNGYGQ